MKRKSTQSSKQSSKHSAKSDAEKHIDSNQYASDWTPHIPPVLESFDTHRLRSKRRLVIAVLIALPYTLDFSRNMSDLKLDPSNAVHLIPEAVYLATVIMLIGYVPRLIGTKVVGEILGRLLPHSESSSTPT